MNWLAHLHLSEPDVEVRLGNVIADFVKGDARRNLNERLRRGVECHLLIDNFTDAHPIFKQSRQRISLPHRKFASILVDVFYDHFLSTHWPTYSAAPLSQFIVEVYDSFLDYTATKMLDAREFVQRMAHDNWLGEYATLDGIERTLARVSRRLQRPGLLTPGIRELVENYEALEHDFHVFYPQLVASVETWQIGVRRGF
jgi:acyl carrier protein phosphodiesterase